MTSTRSAAGNRWPKTQGELFQTRYAEWLDRQAELANFDIVSSDDDDKKHDELTQRRDDALRLAMTTMASKPWMVWTKMQMLDEELASDVVDGQRTDHRHIWMFGCIKADLMHLGIGRRRADA